MFVPLPSAPCRLGRPCSSFCADLGATPPSMETSRGTATLDLGEHVQEDQGKHAASLPPAVPTWDRSPAQWWTRLALSCTCPISGVPIATLPYPPFRLRADPRRPDPRRLVDGKHLALQIIVTGVFEVGGLPLDRSDIEALDGHNARQEPGAHSVDGALLLARAAISPEASPQERAWSHIALSRYVASAWAELQGLCSARAGRPELALCGSSLPPWPSQSAAFRVPASAASDSTLSLSDVDSVSSGVSTEL